MDCGDDYGIKGDCVNIDSEKEDGLLEKQHAKFSLGLKILMVILVKKTILSLIFLSISMNFIIGRNHYFPTNKLKKPNSNFSLGISNSEDTSSKKDHIVIGFPKYSNECQKSKMSKYFVENEDRLTKKRNAK